MSEILLGVGGGIAAYKSCDLLRRLQDQGHGVTVVPTPASLNFVGKATWEALSGKPVHTEVWEAVDQVNHVALGDRADYIIVSPATADLIARLSAGRADDLLSNSILASNAKKLIVPAMHPKMWFNVATQSNVRKLRELGFIVMEPESGRLTGGDSGVGRLPESSTIIDKFINEIAVEQDLRGIKVLITTGGTREAIDDVRFIGNRSSGKQGLAVARIAKARGAEVVLISVNVDTSKESGISVIKVENTEQLQNALQTEFPKCDVLIMAAAVSDAKPIPAEGKVKKQSYSKLDLVPTPDLLAEIAKQKSSQILVGFALETNNELENAKKKLSTKNADIIVLNSLNNSGAGFQHNTNQITILDSKNNKFDFNLKSKKDVAKDILNHIIKNYL